MTAYAFRPMSADDLLAIRRWLEAPHVREWWHDPAEQFELVSGDLGHPDMAQLIVAVEGHEFAYLQCYELSAWNCGFGPQPDGTRGLDQFIGEAGMLGRATVRPSLVLLPARRSPMERRALSPIRIPPTRGRFGPMKRPDFAASASSRRRTEQRC